MSGPAAGFALRVGSLMFFLLNSSEIPLYLCLFENTPEPVALNDASRAVIDGKHTAHELQIRLQTSTKRLQPFALRALHYRT
jgi:hypothetical protein